MTLDAVSGTRRAMRELVDGSIRVQIDIDPAFRDVFLRLFSKIDMPVAIAPLAADFERNSVDQPISVESDEKRGDGHWVAALYRAGWFFNPKVLASLGTDEEYRAWIQRQGSAWSGKFSEYVDGEGRCIAAHVRRAGESGTAFKAPYACIPLTDEEHQRQHQVGESAFGGQQWFDNQRAHYVTTWGHAQLRAALGVGSLKQSGTAELREWAHENGIFSTLPAKVRDE